MTVGSRGVAVESAESVAALHLLMRGEHETCGTLARLSWCTGVAQPDRLFAPQTSLWEIRLGAVADVVEAARLELDASEAGGAALAGRGLGEEAWSNRLCAEREVAYQMPAAGGMQVEGERVADSGEAKMGPCLVEC